MIPEKSNMLFCTLLDPRLTIAVLSFGLAALLAGCTSNEPDGPPSSFTLTDPNVEGHLLVRTGSIFDLGGYLV